MQERPAAPETLTDAFQRLVADLDYPMFVVTAADGEERSGCLVGFSTQCSIDPPRLLVCISKANHTYGVARRAPTLVVHFLSEDDVGLAKAFGERTGDDVDKFAGLEWSPGPGGAPVLAAASGWVAGTVLEQVDAGDHAAFLLALTASGERTGRSRSQLGFQHLKGLDPGHEAGEAR